jgi:hypothetical protein
MKQIITIIIWIAAVIIGVVVLTKHFGAIGFDYFLCIVYLGVLSLFFILTYDRLATGKSMEERTRR